MKQPPPDPTYYGYPYFRPGWVLPFWRGGGSWGKQMFVPDLQLRPPRRRRRPRRRE